MATTPYRHEPLDESKKEMRLLLLDPYDEDKETEIANQPLKCCIKRRSLSLDADLDSNLDAGVDARPEYHAISYSWGKLKGTVPIYVSGRLLEVPKSTENVLRSLHRCSGGISAAVWIDSICIDQENVQEKGKQVAMMDLIFKHAATVHVWLGPSDNSTAAAISSIHAITEERLQGETGGARWLANFATKMGTHVLERYIELPLPNGCNWSALVRFFSSEWFTRLWVVQEAVLARNAVCHCGSLNVPLDDVVLAAYCLESKRRGLQYIRAEEDAGRRGIYNAAQVYALQRAVQPRRLVDLLKLCPRFQTTDLRDKVFGLLGMSDMWTASRHNVMLDPNYSKSNSIEVVYRNATRAALEEDGSLRLLQDAQSLVRSEETPETDIDLRLPSWVPRFHFVRDPDRGALVSIKSQNACNGEKFYINRYIDGYIDHSQEGDVLSLKGLVCDEVATVTEAMSVSLFADQRALQHCIGRFWKIAKEGRSDTAPDPSTAFKAVLLGGSDPEKRQRARGPAQPSPTSKTGSCAPDLVKKIWRFMGGLRWPLSGTSFIKPDIREKGEQTERNRQALQMDTLFARSMIDKRKQWRIKDHEGMSDEQWQSYLDELMNMSVNRVFLITEQGRMGLGPAKTKKGDRICILCGGQVPFVLRREGVYWKLMGDAYLDGVMNGEVFSGRGGRSACWPFDII